jgi:PKD domain
MSDRNLRVLVLLVAVLALALPTVLGSAGVSAAPSAPVALLTGHAPPPPQANCQTAGGALWTPVYGMVGGVWPFDPLISNQPCPPVEMDEIHATFSSNAPNSGSRWTIPIYLPYNATTEAKEYSDFYVGMVLQGDSRSYQDQSYLKITFAPKPGAATYSENLSVLSLVNNTLGGCTTGMQVSFNDSLSYDEINDFNCPNGRQLDGSIPQNTWLNLTFAGSVGSPDGLQIWSNDSASAVHTHNLTLNSVTVGHGLTFNPAYNASCPDTCILNWSEPFGLGIGFDVCPEEASGPFYGNTVLGPTACNSYDQSTWERNPPVQFGIPHYWVDGNYSGDYLYLATESASGLCAATPPNTPPIGSTIALCYNYDSWGGDGFYPFFFDDGSTLEFGNAPADALTTFGGVGVQFETDGYATDLVPFDLLATANDSRDGFAAPGAAINVTAQLLAYGDISNASILYQVAGGSQESVRMEELPGGTAQLGTYAGEIPGTGGNGVIEYVVQATDLAGAIVNSTAYEVDRGPLPTFEVGVIVHPSSCGTLSINGSAPLENGSTDAIEPGYYTLTTRSCYPYQFRTWTGTGGVNVTAPGTASTRIGVAANGTINASWLWVRPHVHVVVLTDPSNCGTVELNGTFATNGTVLTLQFGLPVANSVYQGCAGYAFAGWTLTGNLSILGTSLTAGGNGTVTANFIPNGAGANSLTFETYPLGCGGVLYRGAGYRDGQQLTVNDTSYALDADPCVHWGFLAWEVTGGVGVGNASTANTTVTVSSSGDLLEDNYLLTWIQVIIPTGACGTVLVDGTSYTNGTILVVANNSVHTEVAVPCAHWHLVNVTVTGSLTLVSGNVTATGAGGILEAVFAPGPDIVFVGFITDPVGCGAISFNASTYRNGDLTYVLAGSAIAIAPLPCANFGFVGWVVTGELTVNGSMVEVTDAGSLEAVFAQLANVFVYTQPAGCGMVTIGNQSVVDNSSVVLTETVPYSLAATPCTGMALSGWTYTANANVTAGNISIQGQASVTAEFTRASYALQVAITPAPCNTITVGNDRDSNGSVETLLSGSYSLTAFPCAAQELVGYTVTGDGSVSGSLLNLTGPANLTAEFGWVPPKLSLLLPALAFVGSADEFGANVATPVPPYNYSYSWNFGDGTSAVATSTNATYHAFAQTGTYTVEVTVTDPLHRTATANGTVTVLAGNAAPTFGLDWLPAGLAAGAVLLAVLVALVLAARRPRPPRGAPRPALAPASGESAPALAPPEPEP